MGLVFSAEAHKYFLDGKELASVSSLIAPLGEEMPEDMEGAFALAAERGTELHAVLASVWDAEEREEEMELPEEYAPYLDGVRRFLADHKIEPIAVEEPIYSPSLGVAGTPDLLCYFDGKLAILDYKFVSQVAKTKAKAQLNFYAIIYEEQGIYAELLYIVQFLPGFYRLYPVSLGREEVEACLAIKRLREKKHRRGKID